MKRFAAIVFVLAASTGMAAVDPGLLGMAMPDAKAVAGIQVDQAQSSPFGQYLLSQFPTPQNLEQFIAATGFDPRRDLHEILAASEGGQDGLIVGRGNFQPARIADLATLGGWTSSNYNGVQILTNTKGAKQGSVAFPDASTIIVGQNTQVTAAIDRYLAHTTMSGPLAQMAIQVSGANDAWFATSVPPSSFLTGTNPSTNNATANNLVQSILQTSGGVKFASSGVTFSAQAVTRSDQDAQALVDVLKFLASTVQTNRDSDPRAAKAATLADAATFSTSGATAIVTVSLPEQQIEQLVKPRTATRIKRVARPK